MTRIGLYAYALDERRTAQTQSRTRTGKTRIRTPGKRKKSRRRRFVPFRYNEGFSRKIRNFPTFLFHFEYQIIMGCILKNYFSAARKAEEELKKKEAMAALSTSFGGYKSQGNNDTILKWYYNHF